MDDQRSQVDAASRRDARIGEQQWRGGESVPRPQGSGVGSRSRLGGVERPRRKLDALPIHDRPGTSVSGVIASVGDNNLGVSGVCPRCSILPVRLLGDEAASGIGIAEAFMRAVDLGADAINNSWGPGFSLFFPLSTAERAAFE